MIKKTKIKISTIISKQVYENLVKEADYEDRSLSNMVYKILKDHYKIYDDE